MSTWNTVLASLSATHLPWLVLTMAVYLATMALYRRFQCHPMLIPVFPSVIIVVGVLLATDTPYATYQQGVQWLSILIGPATVALAIPLYAQRARIRALWRPICVALCVGCVVALFSAMGIAWALGGSWETIISLAPKSATIPIALPMAERFGGLPSLAAVAVAVTGISGCMMAPLLLRMMGTKDPAVEGFAQGLTAHAIGTARSIQVNPTAGAFAALAMGLNGVLTALLMPLCVALFQRLG
ncbi:MAG: LrgB family protein [Comamonas sp.]|nr:LrgB family protein [Candidatus Comamonas equi]